MVYLLDNDKREDLTEKSASGGPKCRELLKVGEDDKDLRSLSDLWFSGCFGSFHLSRIWHGCIACSPWWRMVRWHGAIFDWC